MGGFSCLELIGLEIEKEGDAVRRWDLVSGILRHANLSATQRYLETISDVEAIRWIENIYG